MLGLGCLTADTSRAGKPRDPPDVRRHAVARTVDVRRRARLRPVRGDGLVGPRRGAARPDGAHAAGPHLQPLFGLQRRDVEGDRRQRGGGEPRPPVRLPVRPRRLHPRARSEPTRHPGGHQLRQRAQLRTRPVHRDAHAPHRATRSLVRGRVRGRRRRASSLRRRGRAPRGDRRWRHQRRTPGQRSGRSRSAGRRIWC